jgi:hypothetical protein
MEKAQQTSSGIAGRCDHVRRRWRICAVEAEQRGARATATARQEA